MCVYMILCRIAHHRLKSKWCRSACEKVKRRTFQAIADATTTTQLFQKFRYGIFFSLLCAPWQVVLLGIRYPNNYLFSIYEIFLTGQLTSISYANRVI